MAYSDVVSEIQDDELSAIYRLIIIAKEQQYCLRRIQELNQKLECENQAYNSRMSIIEHICKHIKKEPPFMIIQDNKAFQFTETFQVHVSDIDYNLSSTHEA